MPIHKSVLRTQLASVLLIFANINQTNSCDLVFVAMCEVRLCCMCPKYTHVVVKTAGSIRITCKAPFVSDDSGE